MEDRVCVECESSSAKVINRLPEPDKETRKHLKMTNPDMLQVWDKINEIVEEINRGNAKKSTSRNTQRS